MSVSIGSHRMPGFAWLVVAGDLSYGTYLYAFPVQQFFAASERVDLTSELTLTAATTLAIAGLSWQLIERPMLRNRFMDTTSRPTAVTPSVVAQS